MTANGMFAHFPHFQAKTARLLAIPPQNHTRRKQMSKTSGWPPAGPDDLRKSVFTKRKKDVIEFGLGTAVKPRVSPCGLRMMARKAAGFGVNTVTMRDEQ
jgi:hypothetical protein